MRLLAPTHWQELLFTRAFHSCAVCLWKIRGSDRKREKGRREGREAWSAAQPRSRARADRRLPCEWAAAAGAADPSRPLTGGWARVSSPAHTPTPSALTADMRLQLLLWIVAVLLASLLPAYGQRPGRWCLSVMLVPGREPGVVPATGTAWPRPTRGLSPPGHGASICALQPYFQRERMLRLSQESGNFGEAGESRNK